MILFYPRTYFWACRQHAQAIHLLDLFRSYLPWRKSLKAGHSSLSDAQPWICFEAIRHMAAYLQPDMRVFEYGSGGSTLFFAYRAANVVSIEHNQLWWQRVADAIHARQFKNVDLRLIEPEGTRPLDADDSDPDQYASSDAVYQGKSFVKYASAIDVFPDAFFDLIMLDGRARPSCFKHAIPKIKPGGMIAWDNTERENYQKAMKLLPPPAVRHDFFGPCPYALTFAATTIWRLPVMP